MPNVVTYSTAMHAVAMSPQVETKWRLALELLEEMDERSAAQEDLAAKTKAAKQNGKSATGRRYQGGAAEEGQGRYPADVERPNTIHFNNAIKACGRAGQLKAALGVFEDMTAPHRRITPTPHTFAVLIDACRYAGERAKAFEIFHSMADFGVGPNEFTLRRIASVVDDCRLKGEEADIDPAAFADFDARRTVEAILASPKEREKVISDLRRQTTQPPWIRKTMGAKAASAATASTDSGSVSGKSEAKSSDLSLTRILGHGQGGTEEGEPGGEEARRYIQPRADVSLSSWH
mmetsp:Transcript_14974/g.34589  ORF Transcript_14974/g.34589 Transcript_14974/m.34589 type:complete len:291 (+) Transcript_14974:1-873(+)